MDKKAQGISLNVIIIAALALIVLIVLIAIFSGRMGLWGKSLDDIEPECTGVGEPKLAFQCENGIIPGKFKDMDAGWVCCKKE